MRKRQYCTCKIIRHVSGLVFRRILSSKFLYWTVCPWQAYIVSRASREVLTQGASTWGYASLRCNACLPPSVTKSATKVVFKGRINFAMACHVTESVCWMYILTKLKIQYLCCINLEILNK